MKSLYHFKLIAILILFQFITLMNQKEAQAGLSHFVPGGSGIKISTIAPPGFWYAGYFSYYTADTFNDTNGDTSSVTDMDIELFAYDNQFIWITEKKILGADYGVDLHIPLVYTDLSVDVLGTTVTEDDGGGLSDIFIDPLILSWHGTNWDAVVLSGAYIPTGEHDEPASPGRGYWTFMHQVGGTYYFDQAKTWSISTRLRFMHSTEDPDTDITPGNEFTQETGIGKDIPLNNGSILTVGLLGYSYFQLTDDSGPGASTDNFQGHAIGPEIQWTSIVPFVNLSLMYLHEFGVENNTQGDLFTLRVVCKF